MAEFDFVVKNGLVVNTSFTANSTRVALGSNVVLNTSSISVSNSISNVRITESSIIIGNTVANVTVNSTSFTGTANNVSFVGTTAAAAVVNTAQLSANLANYVTTTNLSQNLVNYQTTAGLSANVAKLTANNTSFVGSNPAAAVVNTAQLSANLANYQTTAGLAGNVATLTANSTSFVGSVSAANVVSNVQLSANLTNYQTTAGLSANVARLSANNSTFLNGQAASFYLDASNINAGTLAWARAPVNTVNTTGTFTFTGVQTFNGNTTFNANVNIGTIGLIANGSLGTAGQVLHTNGSSAYWATDDQGVTSVATGNGMIGGTITTTGTVSILANTGIVANSAGTFVNATYIGTLTSNNTSFVGSNPAAAVVNTAQLAAYAPLAGATFTGPLSVTNNVTVTGNLIVTGTTLYANVTNLDVRDKNITVAFGSASAAATDGAGLFVDVSGASMRYTHASNTWEFNIGLIPSANNSWDLGLSTLRWNNVYANNLVAVNVSGNGSSITSVNASTVGGNTAATLRSYSDSTAATAYSNAISVAASDATSKAATAYSNGVSYTQFYAPAKNGTGATGTWGIDISGSANSFGGQLPAYYTDIPSRLGYTPVQQGGGTGQGSNKIYVGWLGSAIGVQVDSNNFGSTWPISITGTANNANNLGGVAAANYARSDSADTLTGLITIAGTGLNGGIKLQNATGARDWRVLQKDTGYFEITDETASAARFSIQGTNAAAGSTFALGNFNFNVYGDVTALYSSDERLKNNVVVISNALEKVKQIRGVEFDWSDEYLETRKNVDNYFVKKHDVGVIAQEIEKVLPEVVSEREDGIKAVKYDRIVALLIEAVKELSTEIEILKRYYK